jgi:serine/threonine-protein kinase RsbW
LVQRTETVRAGVSARSDWPDRMTTASATDTGERPRTIRVPWAPSAVAKTRRVLVSDLDSRGVGSETVGEAEIVVSELIANALRHARPLADGMIRVHWKVKGGVVEVEVSDGGGVSTPRPAPQSLWSSSGRGLRIVRSLAHEWGVTEERNGRTVWAALGGPSRRRSH